MERGWRKGSKSYPRRFVIDEIFLCDNKKELQNAPAKSEGERPADDAAKTMKETKALLELCGASIIFHLPLFVWCTPRSPSSPAPAVISKRRVFTRKSIFFLHPSSGTFPFHFSFPFHHGLAYTQKHNQLYENCERFLPRRAVVCEYPPPHSSLCLKLTTELLRVVWVCWTFYLLKRFSYMKICIAAAFSKALNLRSGWVARAHWHGHHYPFT